MRNKHTIIKLMLFAALIYSAVLIPVSNVRGKNLQPSENADAAKRLIVRVIDGNQRTLGAGIIFSVRGNYLFIVTAQHVVKDIEEINVEFEFWRGIFPKAKPLISYVDKKMDIQVLQVDLQEKELHAFPFKLLPFNQIGYVSNLENGDEVHLIGHPSGTEWDVSWTPSVVDKIVGERIYFEYTCQPGNSGGGLFTNRWGVSGMILRHQYPSCEALSFERIRAAMEDDWGLEVSLKSHEIISSLENTDFKNAERLASEWIAAFAYGDVNKLVRIADPPFYYDTEILTSLRQIRSKYQEIVDSRDNDWDNSISPKVLSLEVKRIRELKTEEYISPERNSILSNMQLKDDDIGVIMSFSIDSLWEPREEVIVFFRKSASGLKMAGFWK